MPAGALSQALEAPVATCPRRRVRIYGQEVVEPLRFV